MSWDDEDYTPNLPADGGGLPTKASWEDEEDEDKTLQELKTGGASSATPAAGPAQPLKMKEKHLEKAKAKEREAKAAAESANSSRLCSNCQASLADQPLADPAAEKKRLEQLIIKSEVAAMQASMGGGEGSVAAGAGGAKLAPQDMSTQVGAVSLLSGDAFKEFGKLSANRVHEASGKATALAMRFYNELLQVGGEKLKPEELAALSKVLDTIRNRKLTEEKGAKKGGAKAKVAKLHMGGDFDSYGGGDYDDYDAGAPAPAAAAAAPAAAVASTGNSGNVSLSAAAAGLGGGSAPAAGGVGEEDSKFVRSRFQAEDDFM